MKGEGGRSRSHRALMVEKCSGVGPTPDAVEDTVLLKLELMCLLDA